MTTTDLHLTNDDYAAMEKAKEDCFACEADLFEEGFRAGMVWAKRNMPATADGVKVMPNHDSIWINPGTGGFMSADEGWFTNDFDPPVEISSWSHHGDHIYFQPKGQEDSDGYYWDGKFYSSYAAAIQDNPLRLDGPYMVDIVEVVADNLEGPVDLDEAIRRALQRDLTDDEIQTIKDNMEEFRQCAHCKLWIDTDNCEFRETVLLDEYACCLKCYEDNPHLHADPDDPSQH
jgi:translation initiation factor 2 beta subunit (eIF-2beta)/eIF-5